MFGMDFNKAIFLGLTKYRYNNTNYKNFRKRHEACPAECGNSDVSIWLSVDPLSDKYPSLSPYAYCANNPVIYIDPDGRNFDEWEVLFASDGSVKVNWMSDKGGENTQIVNFSYENAQGDHVQFNEPLAYEISANDIGSSYINGLSNSNNDVTSTDNSNWAVVTASSYLMFLKIDLAIPDVTDAMPPKWVAHGVLTLISAAILYDAGVSFMDQFSKRRGDKEYDDEISPLSSGELARLLKNAKSQKDTQLKRRVEKEQKRRKERNAQKRNSN